MFNDANYKKYPDLRGVYEKIVASDPDTGLERLSDIERRYLQGIFDEAYDSAYQKAYEYLKKGADKLKDIPGFQDFMTGVKKQSGNIDDFVRRGKASVKYEYPGFWIEKQRYGGILNKK